MVTHFDLILVMIVETIIFHFFSANRRKIVHVQRAFLAIGRQCTVHDVQIGIHLPLTIVQIFFLFSRLSLYDVYFISQFFFLKL